MISLNLLNIVFVCHGNICRSPMAECVMQHLVNKERLQEHFYITSAAVSREEIGNPIYLPAARILRKYGVDYANHCAAHQISLQEFQKADLVVLMDHSNLRLLKHLIPHAELDTNSQLSEALGMNSKVCLLMDFSERAGAEVADPWYTGNFELTYSDILDGCTGLLSQINGRT